MQLGRFTYLNAVLKEAGRIFAGPIFFFRVAKHDFVLPTSLGDFDVKAGERLLIPTQIVHCDPEVYPNPMVFDPDRFIRDPDLAKRLIWMGAPVESDAPYHCVAGLAGVIDRILGYALARLVRDHDRSMRPEPQFQYARMQEDWIEPLDVEIHDFRRREVPR